MKAIRIKPRLRLWSIYNELGSIPWHSEEKKQKKRKGVYIGTREAIPFMNDDAKRTLSHLLLRPGYMMRDYVLRGDHERYLSPLTALLVFYSLFTFVVAVVQPESYKDSFGDRYISRFDQAAAQVDSTSQDEDIKKAILSTMETIRDAILYTRLDLYPEAVDTPWKASLAAVEGNLRSKGVPLFLGGFLPLWLALGWLLRKYKVSFSGAAASSAYILCQFCIFMFLALLLSLGQKSDLGLLLMSLPLFIDFRQMLGIGNKKAVKLVIKTWLLYALIQLLFYMIVGTALVTLAIYRM